MISTNGKDFAETFKDSVISFSRKLLAKDAGALTLRYVKPVTAERLKEIENSNGIDLPIHLQRLLTEVASSFEFFWIFDDSDTKQEIASPVRSGFANWDIDRLAKLIQIKRQTEEETVFEEAWTDKVPFMNFGNGNYLAVSREISHKVFYLTPAEPPDCIVPFDCNLFEFLLAWARIGCVNEQTLLRFRDHQSRLIDHEQALVHEWISWLGKAD